MRVWVFQTLKLSGLWSSLGGRIYQTSRMNKVPDEKPYGFYRMGLSSGMLHTDAPVWSTPFQLFLHDVPGDYMQIDDLLQQAKLAFTQFPSLYPDSRLIRCEWQGQGEDGPEDPLTGTISKVASYRLVHLP